MDPKLQALRAALRNPNILTSNDAIHGILSGIAASVPTPVYNLIHQAVNSYLVLTKASIADGIAIVFTLAMALSATCLVLFYLVPEAELHTSNDHHPTPEA